MAEKAGPPRVLVRRHILEIRGGKDDKRSTREWLEEEVLSVVKLGIAMEPVKATLGNPVAFPILAGGAALLIGILYLRSVLPKGSPEAAVREAAETITEIIQEIIPPIFPPPVEGQPPSTLETLRQGLVDLLMRIWNDPLFGVGGGGPFQPGKGPLKT